MALVFCSNAWWRKEMSYDAPVSLVSFLHNLSRVALIGHVHMCVYYWEHSTSTDIRCQSIISSKQQNSKRELNLSQGWIMSNKGSRPSALFVFIVIIGSHRSLVVDPRANGIIEIWNFNRERVCKETRVQGHSLNKMIQALKILFASFPKCAGVLNALLSVS